MDNSENGTGQSAAAVNRFNSGEVEILLDGDKTIVLRPTLRAAQAISRNYGGFVPCIQKLMSLELEAVLFVLRHGVGITNEREVATLNERAYKTGVGRLVGPCSDYVTMLSNGGKPLDPLPTATNTEGESVGAR